MRNALLIVAHLAALAVGVALALRRPEPPVDAPAPQPSAAAPPPAQLAGRSAAPVPPRAPAPAPSPPADDENRRATEIIELVRQGKVGHARALADQFYRAYPRSPRGAEIERLTGYHPRPYGPER